MRLTDLAAGATKIVRTCAAVRAGETVLVLTDVGVSPRVAEALAFAVTMPRPRRPGDEPPPLVAAAMTRAEVILAPTSLSIFHTDACRAACEAGTRILAISECSEETLTRGGIEADFPAHAAVAERLAGRLRGERLEVRTPGGTDLVVSIDGRRAVVNSGMADRPGVRMGMPTIEAYIAPVEGTAEGRLVVDASLGVLGLVTAPIGIRVTQGRARSFEGGPQAAALSAIVAGAGSADAFMLAEVGIGLNPGARVVGRIIEDEGAYGTCHVALGSNVHFGGTLQASLHLDMVMREPRITVDGRVLMDRGRLVEEEG
jgi:leucyl aminopeptidase (aminopeptidase T)